MTQAKKHCQIIMAIISFTLIFVLLMITLAYWNYYNKSHKPMIQQINGILCQDYLYFPNITNINVKQCLKECPNNLSPRPLNIGFICFVSDQTSLQIPHQIISALDRYQLLKYVIYYAALISISIGIVLLSLSQLSSKLTVYLLHYGSIVWLIGLVGVMVGWKSGYWSGLGNIKVLYVVICLILCIAIIYNIYKNELHQQSMLLTQSIQFVNQYPFNYIYILLFMGLMVIVLCFNYWQFSTLTAALNKPFGVKQLILLTLVITQCIWSMQFLRCLFYYLIVVGVTNHAWKHSPSNSSLCKSICFNIPGIIAYSFVNGFVSIINGILTYQYFFKDYIPQLYFTYFIKHSQSKQMDKHKQYTLIESSSNLRFICEVFCVSLGFLLCSFILQYRIIQFCPWKFLISIIIIYSSTTFIVGIYMDTMVAIQSNRFRKYNSQYEQIPI